MQQMRQIFVFGSNREGRLGGGAARTAVELHGAIWGQAEGLQGESYAIVTKELRADCQPVTLAEVAEGVERFLDFARNHPELWFQVTPIGCGLAGFKPDDIGPLFRDAPLNCGLPEVFLSAIAHS